MKHRRLVAALTTALVVVGGAAAWASIPDTNGTIHGCRNIKTGALRVIDTDAGQTCMKGEAALSWNQTGPQGPAGPPGPQGPAGVSGYELVTRHVDIDPGTDTDRMAGVFAVCPVGKRVIGGGGGSVAPHLYPGRNDVILQSSFPSTAGNSEDWTVITRRIGDTPEGYSVDVWAICGDAS